jgi:hypothetical protein
VEAGDAGAALALGLERTAGRLYVLATYSAMLELRPIALRGAGAMFRGGRGRL